MECLGGLLVGLCVGGTIWALFAWLLPMPKRPTPTLDSEWERWNKSHEQSIDMIVFGKNVEIANQKKGYEAALIGLQTQLREQRGLVEQYKLSEEVQHGLIAELQGKLTEERLSAEEHSKAIAQIHSMTDRLMPRVYTMGSGPTIMKGA